MIDRLIELLVGWFIVFSKQAIGQTVVVIVCEVTRRAVGGGVFIRKMGDKDLGDLRTREIV